MEWSIPPSISSTEPSRVSDAYLDNLTNYTQLFHGNRYNKKHVSSKNLLLLKKKEFDIFYSTHYKYPLLVAETITSRTGLTDPNHPLIDRRKIEDSFRQDIDVPENYQHTLANYKAYMEYGGSMGHNAPAGQHKTNIDVYNETFVLTNITPQEMVLNSGLWVLIEQWCRHLGRNTHIEKIIVMTGSIPAMFDNEFNGVIMNVPTKMFKIICIKMATHTGNNACHMEIFLCHNKPYTINYASPSFDLSKYLIHHTQYQHFQRESGIDLNKLLEYYGFQSSTDVNRIKSFRTHLNMSIPINPSLRLLMKKSKWFGKLIYAKNIDTLEREWNECQKLSKEFESLRFHQEYYELTKQRLKRGSRLSRTLPTTYTWESLYQRNMKQTTRKNKHSSRSAHASRRAHTSRSKSKSKKQEK